MAPGTPLHRPPAHVLIPSIESVAIIACLQGQRRRLPHTASASPLQRTPPPICPYGRYPGLRFAHPRPRPRSPSRNQETGDRRLTWQQRDRPSACVQGNRWTDLLRAFKRTATDGQTFCVHSSLKTTGFHRGTDLFGPDSDYGSDHRRKSLVPISDRPLRKRAGLGPLGRWFWAKGHGQKDRPRRTTLR